jgi:hypothetical protein
MQWAQRDPRSAANWALRVQNEQARDAAIASVATQWASSEPDSATQWAMTMPRGHDRDSALQSVISIVASKRVPENTLFEGIEDELTRQQAAVTAAYRLARSDMDAADQLVERYVTDATLLKQFQQRRPLYFRY